MAISPNNNEIHIYTKKAGKWEVEHKLTEHTSRVTGIDWAPKSGSLVTCAAVSHMLARPHLLLFGITTPTLFRIVMPMCGNLKVGLGNLFLLSCVSIVLPLLLSGHHWRTNLQLEVVPASFLFVTLIKIMTGKTQVSSKIGLYCCGLGRWVSKHIKKPLRSTVTSLDWHPNNYLIAAGCSDFKARVFSTYVKEIEEKPSETVWGKKMPFGNVMAEFSNGGGKGAIS